MLTDPRQLIASLIVSLWLVVLPSNAVAQTGAPEPLSMDRQLAASARVSPLALALDRPSLTVRALTGRAQLAQPGRSRDSLKNGTIIGAVVGAVALGAFGAVVCKVQQGGIGGALVKAAEDWAASQGATAILVNRAHHRHDAHEFYERAGYRSTGVRFVKKLEPAV